MKKFYAGILCASLVLGATIGGSVNAQEGGEENADFPTVYFSEINWSGSELTHADEWFEIANRSGEEVDIGGWSVTGAGTSGSTLVLPEELVIEPFSVVLISNYAAGNTKSTLDAPADYVTSAVALPNTKLTMELLDRDGNMIDIADFGNGTPKAGSVNPYTSAIRTIDGFITADKSMNLLDSSQMGTPGIWDDIEFLEEELDGSDIVGEENDEDNSEEVEEELDHGCPVLDNGDESDENVQNDDTNDVESESDVSSEEGNDLVDDSDAEEDELFDSAGDMDGEEVDSSNEIDMTTDTEQEDGDEMENVDEVICTCLSNENEEEFSNESTGEEQMEDLDEVSQVEEENYFTMVLAGKLKVNEFNSNPAEGPEWIELFNDSDETLLLDGAFILDNVSGKTVLEGILEPQDYHMVYSPKGILNNGGDFIALYDADGELIDYVEYGTADLKAPKKGEFGALVNGQWTITTEGTPGFKNAGEGESNEEDAIYGLNNISQETQTYENSGQENDAEAENYEVEAETATETEMNSTMTQTTGNLPTSNLGSSNSSMNNDVSENSTNQSGLLNEVFKINVVPGLLGKQIAYVNGYQLYLHNSAWPELRMGDVVKVSGELSSVRGETRFKVQTGSKIEVVGYEEVSFMDLAEALKEETRQGLLASTKGVILQRDGRNLVLQTSSGNILVKMHTSLGLTANKIDGDRVAISGVLRVTNDGLELHPFDINQIRVISEAELLSGADDGSNLMESEGFEQSMGSNEAEDEDDFVEENKLPVAGIGLFTGSIGAIGYWFKKSLNKLT